MAETIFFLLYAPKRAIYIDMLLPVQLRRCVKKCGLALLFYLAVVLLAVSTGTCADDLKVVRDKEGTTWSVGSSESREQARAEEERDKDRAWDMLRNQSILIDKRKQEK